MILRAHDFAKFRFLSAWIEYNDVPDRRTELESIMLPKGYTRVMDTSHDLLFVSKELL